MAEAAEAKAKGEANRARTAEQEMRRQWYAASINLMQPAWDTGQVGRLHALLAETEAYPERGFEWYYWQRLCHLEQHTLIGHRDVVNSVSWSPDGTRLATGSRDGTAKVWDAASGRERLTLRGHAGRVLSVSWSPDGTRLATGSWGRDGEGVGRRRRPRDCSPSTGIRAWSGPCPGRRTGRGWRRGVRTARRRCGTRPAAANSLTLKGHTGRASVSWSPDGTRLATGSGDGTAKVWDAAGGRELLTLKGHTGPVWSVSWSPDGRRLATGSRDGTAKVWDAAGGRELLTLKGHTGAVNSVSWSPDGTRLATGSWDGTAKVWDAASGRELLTLKGHTSGVNSVSWSPDGTRLATGSEDGTAKVWDTKAVKEVTYHVDHASQWVLRLGDGTDESHARMQAALDAEWPYVDELFAPLEPSLAGRVVDPADLRERRAQRPVASGRAGDADRARGPARARRRPPGSPHRAPRPPARRDAAPPPLTPGGHMVTSRQAQTPSSTEGQR